MMKKTNTLLFAGMMLLYGISCLAAESIEVITPGHKAKLTHQAINETSLLVSVKDAEIETRRFCGQKRKKRSPNPVHRIPGDQ